jgi:glycosyltransferase involved in cell wall biosynthesis
VLPTKNEGRKEGTPVAMLEAMANGKVVLGSAIPGINDQLKSYPNHRFEAGNAIDLQNKLSFFMKNSIDENKKIGYDFQQLVKSNFTIETEIKKHQELYLTLT